MKVRDLEDHTVLTVRFYFSKSQVPNFLCPGTPNQQVLIEPLLCGEL